jgi:hypothetical protein
MPMAVCAGQTRLWRIFLLILHPTCSIHQRQQDGLTFFAEPADLFPGDSSHGCELSGLAADGRNSLLEVCARALSGFRRLAGTGTVPLARQVQTRSDAPHDGVSLFQADAFRRWYCVVCNGFRKRACLALEKTTLCPSSLIDGLSPLLM